MSIPPPSAGDEVVRHADWCEWRLLTTNAEFFAWSDYAAVLRKFASEAEASAELEVPDDPFEALMDALASELQARETAAGGAYPFYVTPTGLQRSAKSFISYEFMLALALFGDDQAETAIHPERVFEKLCSEALAAYLGRPAAGARSEVFGFPRPVLPKSFRGAVEALCKLVGEGLGCKCEPNENMKDASLDVVGWRQFPDGSPSQLLVFGQCATGDNWPDKLNELQPLKWCQLWLAEIPAVVPVAAFFLPRRVESANQRRARVLGGVFFDRCRVAWLTQVPSDDLVREMSEWLASVGGRAVRDAA